MSEYWCAECDEWNVNCSCKASKIIKELEEKLAVAQKSLVDYETDWVKMRKYYDGAMVKVNEMEKASIQSALTLTDTIIQMSEIEEKLAEKEMALNEACEVIGFYADEKRWIGRYCIIEVANGVHEKPNCRATEFLAKIKR